MNRPTIPARITEVLGAAVAPLAACVLALTGLTAWTLSGQAGRPAELTVTDARVWTAPNPAITAAFFTISNTGEGADDLVAVTSPLSDDIMLSRSVDVTETARTMEMLDSVPIGPGEVLEMTPLTLDVMVRRPEPVAVGDQVPFTLHFRNSPSVTVRAEVVSPGS
ncbi:copper chaperone PCu(A)C [Streptomyces litchfieldiae]|uniref:Copper chaperone PCu(A)C n=1 Tax=Streptomyces litchfieldiae TaxID=3075543 RepID=A0ABU2MXQ2_9ACTN|nr:copper chaperone PCu(A)C [Streptomyces sp. DSM 44938]MDT0346443.1 copper chaperone PCu(A)C [Streptomyces sp. DSM 44938]